MCGIVGMVGSAPVNQDIYDALLLLQHRGQDATGIATAEGAGMEVTTDTAQYMAHSLARLLGRQDSALERFARSGDGDYLELREEYLELYADPMIPGHAKEWINWLGTYLVRRENDQPASGEEAGDGTR